jgi:ferredoxin-NADP reductase
MATTTVAILGVRSVTKVIETAAPTPGPWEIATVVSVKRETSSAKTFRIALPSPAVFLSGQHFLIRLTSQDGYTATRSYSVASAPDGTNEIELTVERLVNGEVSPFLHDVVVPGDTFEVRGPVGGFFVWRGDSPVFLVGGGSGVVPLMSMLRLARQMGRPDLVRLLVSARTPQSLYFAEEIVGPETTVIYTRVAPEGSVRGVGRIRIDDVKGVATRGESVYVCGSAGFADAATSLLIDADVPAESIRVERFGLSG